MNIKMSKLRTFVYNLLSYRKVQSQYSVIDHLNLQLSHLTAKYDLLIHKYDSERKEKDKGLRRQSAKLKSLKSRHSEVSKKLRDLEVHIISNRTLYISDSNIAPKLLAEYTLCTQQLRQTIYKLDSH